MKRFLIPCSVAALMLAACEEATRPVTIQKPATIAADVQADASSFNQFFLRADGSNDAVSAEDPNSAIAALGGASSAASSGTTECVGVLVGAFDKVEVPPDATCILTNSTVTQWVKADAGSRLLISNSQIGADVMGLSPRFTQIAGPLSHVFGNVHIDNAGDVSFASCAVFTGATIDGNFRCNNGNPAAPRVFGAVTIGGSIDIIGNFVPPAFHLQLQHTTIGGNAHISNNATVGASKIVNLNTVAKTLVCENNDLPFLGGPNIAGRAQGQCF